MITGTAYAALQVVSGNPVGIVISQSVIASVIAFTGSYYALKERVGSTKEALNNHVKENNSQFAEIKSTLSETAHILRELTGDVGELVGEARERRKGHVRSRDSD